MNTTCAHCGHKIEKATYGKIICDPCEISWWNKIKYLYAEKIKELGL